MKPYLKLETHPLANPENVIKGDKYRITVLTEHLLRLEYSEDGEFIDAASQTVVNRDFPAVEFSVKDTGDGPTPITPIRMNKETRQITLAYFEQKSTVDYIGVIQGIPVCFDAKE